MENLAKDAFYSFCFSRWKFLKQTPLYSPENSKIFFVTGTFVQNDNSRSYSCLNLTYAL